MVRGAQRFFLLPEEKTERWKPKRGAQCFFCRRGKEAMIQGAKCFL